MCIYNRDQTKTQAGNASQNKHIPNTDMRYVH